MGRKAPKEFVRGIDPNSEAAKVIHALHTGAELPPVPSQAKEVLARLDPNLIDYSPDNPRIIDERSERFKAFAQNVAAMGVKMHVRVRPHPETDGRYQLLAGERRVRAAKAAGLKEVPAVISTGLSDEEAFELTFAENFGREDLTPMEEGREVEILLQKFRGDAKAVAVKLGRTEQWVSTRARLKKLSPAWRKSLAEEESLIANWGIAHLVLIARFPEAQQEEIHRELMQDDASVPVMTPKDLDQWINGQMLRRLDKAPFDVQDAGLDPKAGPCTECPKRASCQGKLFLEAEEESARKKQDQCTDPACWKRKEMASLLRKAEKLKAEHGGKIMIVGENRWDDHSGYDAAVKAFGELSDTGRYHEVKKGDAGAVPGLVVSGKSIGKLKYYKLNEYYAKQEKGSREAGKPTPLAERRKTLAGRRLALVLQKLTDRMQAKDLQVEISPNNLMALAATFGTEWNYPHIENDKRWMDWAKLADDSQAARSALWAAVKPVLVKRLRVFGAVGELGKRHESEALSLCNLMGWTLNGLLVQAEKELPEPKSWANLNANGTPKAKPAVKAKSPKAGAGGAAGATVSTPKASAGAAGAAATESSRATGSSAKRKPCADDQEDDANLRACGKKTCKGCKNPCNSQQVADDDPDENATGTHQSQKESSRTAQVSGPNTDLVGGGDPDVHPALMICENFGIGCERCPHGRPYKSGSLPAPTCVQGPVNLAFLHFAPTETDETITDRFDLVMGDGQIVRCRLVKTGDIVRLEMIGAINTDGWYVEYDPMCNVDDRPDLRAHAYSIASELYGDWKKETEKKAKKARKA